MRLPDFILANIEPILVDWVNFARTITPEKNIAVLRDQMQFGANHTPVELSVTGEASEVVINVHSEGNPIPPEKLPLLFHPMSYRPGHGTTALRPGSVGLGLYIVREIVTAHAGSVHVQSSREAGTDFTVRLPR